MGYFSDFPVVEYAGRLARNITANVRMDAKTKNNALMYHQYAMKDSDDMRVVAGKYYDNEHLIWLVYMANDIVDPYYGESLDENEFAQYLANKYGSVERAHKLTAVWINDWYGDDTELTIGAYEALLPALKKYYDPVLDYHRNVISYKRARTDMRVNTNIIQTYVMADPILEATRTVLDVYAGVNIIGSCELVTSEDDRVTVNNVYLTDDDTPTHLAVDGSDDKVAIESLAFEHENITLAEAALWRRLSVYDAEFAANEAKKNIRLISSQYAGEFQRQLTEKLQAR